MGAKKATNFRITRLFSLFFGGGGFLYFCYKHINN